MNSDEDKLYIKIVVEMFLNWKYLGSKNIVVSAQILKFEI